MKCAVRDPSAADAAARLRAREADADGTPPHLSPSRWARPLFHTHSHTPTRETTLSVLDFIAIQRSCRNNTHAHGAQTRLCL